MEDIDGETLTKWWFFAVSSLFVVVLVFWLALPKHIHSYTLSDGGEGGDNLYIRVDIENAQDDHIPLIGVDYKEAVAIVDSLNNTIPE